MVSLLHMRLDGRILNSERQFNVQKNCISVGVSSFLCWKLLSNHATISQFHYPQCPKMSSKKKSSEQVSMKRPFRLSKNTVNTNVCIFLVSYSITSCRDFTIETRLSHCWLLLSVSALGAFIRWRIFWMNLREASARREVGRIEEAPQETSQKGLSRFVTNERNEPTKCDLSPIYETFAI